MKILSASLDSTFTGDHMAKFRALKRADGDSGGDTASFSKDALTLANVDKETKFTASTLKTKVGGDDVTFDNATGVVTWGGKKLNLKGIADTLKTDEITIQKHGEFIDVYTGGKSYKLKASGEQSIGTDGEIEGASATLKTDAAMLVINNRSSGSDAGGTGNDVIINREVGGTLKAAAGNDTIANFAKSVDKVVAGDGNNALFSVGLTSGTLEAQAAAGTGNSYTKIVSNMLGGEITMGKGANVLDATGVSLNNATIKDGGNGSTSTAIAAKNMQDSTVTLGAAKIGIDVSVLSSELTLGTGSNSLVADTVKSATIKSPGTDSFQFKTLENSMLDANSSSNSKVLNVTGSAANSQILLGRGLNTINAEGKTLTSMKISDTDNAATVILAGAIEGNAGAKTEIDLKGKAGEENGVIVSKGINYADIKTGKGAGEVKAASVSNSTVTMGAATEVQKVTVTGAFSNSSLTTSGGEDVVSVGSVSKSKVELGAGNNTMTVNKTADGLDYVGGEDNDKVVVKGALSNSDIKLGAGANKLEALNGTTGQTITNTNITSTDQSTTVITGGTYKSGVNGNEIKLGSGMMAITLASITNTNNSKLIIDGSAGTTNHSLTVGGKVTGLDYKGSAGVDTIAINGAVTNADFTLGAGADTFTAQNGKKVNQALTNVNISGTAGDKTITAGAYKAGANGNTISLGSGANTVVLNSISGTNNSTLGMTLFGAADKAQSLTVKGKVNNLAYTGSAGIDAITVEGAIANSSIDLGGGANSLTAQKTGGKFQSITNTNIFSLGVGSATTIKGGAYTAGAGGNTINLAGTGANSIELNSTAGTQNSRLNIHMNHAGGAGGDQTLKVAGTMKNVTYKGSAGKDIISSGGAVSNGDFALGSGEDSFTAENSAQKRQNVSNTNITATGAGKTTIAIGKYTAAATGNTITLGAGANSVEMTGTAGKGLGRLTINNTDGTGGQSVTVTGAMSAVTYNGGDGGDEFIVEGAVSNSDINLGAGDNSFSAKNIATGKMQSMTNTNISSSGMGANSIEAGAYKTGKAGNTINLAGTHGSYVTLASITGGKNSMLVMEVGTGDLTSLKVKGNVSNVSLTTTGNGTDYVFIDGKLTNSTMNLGGGSDQLKIGGATNGLNYKGGAGSIAIEVAATLSNSNFDFGKGINILRVNKQGDVQTRFGITNTNITADVDSITSIYAGAYVAGAEGNNITLGSGDNTVDFASIGGTKGSMLNIDTSAGLAANSQNLIVTGKLSNTIYKGSAGADDIKSGGAVSNSNFDLGEGTNSFTAESTDAAKKLQALNNVDIIASGNAATDVTTITAGAYTSGKTGNIISLGAGANKVELGGVASQNGSTLTMRMGTEGTAAQTVEITGAVNRLSYFGSKGADNLTVNGNISNSNINFGEGTNALTATAIEKGKLTGQILNNVNLSSSGTEATDKTSVTLGGFSGSGKINLTGDTNIELIA